MTTTRAITRRGALATTMLLAASAGLPRVTGRAATPTAAQDGDQPTWQTLELTEVHTGETFTLGDFEGRTVYVEPMATWCPPCREQLGNVAQAREELDTEEEEFVFVALSTEMGMVPEMLTAYADDNGFDFRFAVMTPELLGALVEEFGRAVAVPPGTPHFLIQPDGSATELETGTVEADALVEQLAAAAAEGDA